MEDKLCFVQFIHPGGEHDTSSGTGWNTEPHRRKFLQSNGRYLGRSDLREEPLALWGEWEAESRVIAQFPEGLRGEPRYLFDPYYVPKDTYVGLQNTDPFVFGDQFHYTGCLQHTSRGPTQLRHLARGSVILFGSRVRERFAIDTVFVVDRFVDHGRADYHEVLTDSLSETYRDVTFGPWYGAPSDDDRTFRLYFGATYDSPVEGMFSFVPSLPIEGEPAPFDRPAIELPGIINPRVQQGKKLNPQPSIAAARSLWRSVVDQVVTQGLAPAVKIEMPRREEPEGGLERRQHKLAAATC